MTLTRCGAVTLILVAVSASFAAPAAAERHRDVTPARAIPRVPHIRSTDPHLLALIRDGAAMSGTLRRLVDRLERSDVVVYLYCGGDPQSRIAGRLSFLTAAAGLRYVIVHVTPQQRPSLAIAVLGHELQHAVEIADTPAIVDSASLAREYQRFGHVNNRVDAGAIAFDTRAAVTTGHRVLAELLETTGD